MRKLNYSKANTLNGLQLTNGGLNIVLTIFQLVHFAVFPYELILLKTHLKDRRYIRNPLYVLFNCWVADLKFLRLRIKRDANPFLFIISIGHFQTGNCGLKGSHALLTVDQDFLPVGNTAVLQLHVRVLPDNNVSNRKTFIQGVQQISDLSPIPDEGTLYFRDGYLSGLDPTYDIFNRRAVNIKLSHLCALLYSTPSALNTASSALL